MAAVLLLQVLNELSFSISTFLDPLGGHSYYYFWVPVIFICGGIYMISLWRNIADRNIKDLLRLRNQMLLLRVTKRYHSWDPVVTLYADGSEGCFSSGERHGILVVWLVIYVRQASLYFLPEPETWEPGEEKFCFCFTQMYVLWSGIHMWREELNAKCLYSSFPPQT